MLKLVPENQKAKGDYDCSALEHHNQLIKDYMSSHRVHNYSKRTLEKYHKHIVGWFKIYGTELRPLFVWEAMEPILGRKRIADYALRLLDCELANQTIRSYVGILREFFTFVLDRPYVFENGKSIMLREKYNTIAQPVSDYDIPQHSFDSDHLGLPLEPDRLHEFYQVIKDHYLQSKMYPHMDARNYSMIVVAGETGMRANEIRHLNVMSDLFFKSRRIQAREGKAAKGSGPRARTVPFTPLARDTITYFLNNHRSKLKHADKSNFLYFSRTGKMLPYSQMQRFLKDMIKVANQNGLWVGNHFGWHWFRRIFATRFLERYPSKVNALMQLLGHTSYSTLFTSYAKHSQFYMDNQLIELLEKDNFDGDILEL